MIDRALPPVRRGLPNSFDERLEAFALCYLAADGDGSLSNATVESYRRAWGFDNLKYFARVPNQRPAFVMALYTSVEPNQIVVAIEGTTSMSQILSLSGSFLCGPGVTNRPGRVHSQFRAYADALQTALYADADYLAVVSRREHRVTYAGFSLGAAVAEVAAVQSKWLNPARTVALKKFAAPRVGNSAWYRDRPATMSIDNFILGSDPICNYPGLQVTRVSNAWLGLEPLTYLSVDPVQSGQRFINLTPTGYFHVQLDREAAFLRNTWLPMNRQNLWWQHGMRQYRTHFQTAAIHLGRNLPYYRMAGLRLNRETNWQEAYSPGSEMADFTPLVNGPANADLVVPPSLYSTQIRPLELLVDARDATGKGNWGNGDWDAGGVAGEWNEERISAVPRGRARR